MAFLRLTRDRRGYENTFLLHSPHPGARPIVLYWYRSAPGVRVGRPALDEDAIRTIEEQHPDIDFDWPHILEVGAITEPEIERRPVRQKRRPEGRPSPARDEQPPAPDETAEAVTPEDVLEAEEALAEADAALTSAYLTSIELDPEVASTKAAAEIGPRAAAAGAIEGPPDEATAARARPHDLLEGLVGHEIATRLHARYSEIISRVHRFPESDPRRAAWEARAESLNPDNWVTPDEILHGVSHADALFDSLRKELLAH